MRLDLDLEVDLLAHQEAARLDGHVPGHPPVLAVDRRPRRRGEHRLRFHIRPPSEELSREGDGPRDVLDREVAVELERGAPRRPHGGARERQHRVLLGLEEVAAHQVLVALFGVRRDALGLHLDLDARILRRVADLDRSGELRELAPHLRQHVSRHEPDHGVDRVELVRSGGRDRHPLVLPALDRRLRHLVPPLARPRPVRELYLQAQTQSWPTLLHMQIDEGTHVAGLLDRLVAAELPEGRGLDAWVSLLQAHASLMRRLESDLERETGLALADFDVLAQLARAGGELRMTELAARGLISRSGMTRRVARLVDEGLVRRADADADGRGVVVALTDAGVARLAETAPVHARGISKLFVAQLDDQELAILERALGKVIIDCSFG